jgi:hypothetical protein
MTTDETRKVAGLLEDPDVVLLRVDAATAEYWDSPGGRLASVISFAKAKLTGQAYDGGENETVRL